MLRDRTAIGDLLDNIRANLVECVSEQGATEEDEDATILGPPGSSHVYVSTPPADCCDMLVVWPERLANYVAFPIPNPSASGCEITGRMVLVHARLYRPCWPALKDNPQNPFPSAEEMQAATDALNVDLNVMWCCAMSGFNGAVDGCDAVSMVDGRWGTPSGGCAWTEIIMWVELDPCC